MAELNKTQDDYLEKYGNIQHCWKIHRRRMQERHEPRVTYASFRHRVRDLGRPIYQAIHTPANVEKRDKNRRHKVAVHKLKFRIKMFFRKIFNLGWTEKK